MIQAWFESAREVQKDDVGGLSGEGNEKMEKYWVNGNNKYRKISWIWKYELVMVKLGKYDDMWGFRYGK